MLAPILLASLLFTGSATAVDGACGVGGYATASLLGDLGQAIQQMIPFPGRFGAPAACTGACAARRSVLDETKRHERLLDERGVGTWYGDGNAYEILSDEQRQTWLEEHTKAGQRVPSPEELKRGSCIEWVMAHVEAYYESIGDLATWERIEKVVRGERLTGTSLARELKAAGWTSIYLNADGDFQGIESKDNEHVYSRAVVDRDGTYYDVPVDESIVDWRENPSRLSALEAEPFFIFIARGGLHTAAGVDGQLSELARGQGPDEKVLYQDPLRDIIDIYAEEVHSGGAAGLDSAMHMWGSGLALVPPGGSGRGK
jgi:hypothetical protein